MSTDNEIRAAGVNALVAALGELQAEKFIALIRREPFDYTAWQQGLWPDRGIDEISRAAMEHRRESRQ